MSVKRSCMTESESTTPAAASARRKATQRRNDGWIRNSYWLSPISIDVLDQARERMGLSSREATVNAVLERIDSDMFLKQEFLAVTK